MTYESDENWYDFPNWDLRFRIHGYYMSNDPPLTPSFSTGVHATALNVERSFTLHAWDPDEDEQLQYKVDWHDGWSGWTDFTNEYNEGGYTKASKTISHTWTANFNGDIKVRTRDDEFSESPIYYWAMNAYNHDPELPDGYIDPTGGDHDTSFQFSAKYADADGDPPGSKTVYYGVTGVGQVDHEMTEGEGSYVSGKWHHYSSIIGQELDVYDGDGWYYFYFDDGNGHSVRKPATGTYSFIISSDNIPPTAYIDSISPNPAEKGEIIFFEGSDDGDPDGDVVGYNWRSSIDEDFSTQKSFSTSSLSAGAHTIYFKVQDDEGAWSEEVSEFLNISYYFVHITDPHVTYDPSKQTKGDERWQQDLDEIRSWDPPPSFILCTGDLVEWGYDFLPGSGGEDNFYGVTKHLYGSKPNFYLDQDHNIPIYFCPGNHDARPDMYPAFSTQNFEGYYNCIGGDYQNIEYENNAIFTLNSGADDWGSWIPWWDPWRAWQLPEGDGIKNAYGNEVDNLPNDLDNLDDDPNNNVDDSLYAKIIATHHPYVSYYHDETDIKDGSFTQNRNAFKNACIDYGVHLALAGHQHRAGENHPPPLWYKGSIKYIDGTDWPYNSVEETYSVYEEDPTAFVITNSIKDSNSYRNITVLPSSTGNDFIIDLQERFTSTINIDGGCLLEAHVYDSDNNHNGPNETGVIEREIPYSSYSHMAYSNESQGINETFTEMSIYREYEKEYNFTLNSLSDGMNATIHTSLKEGYDSVAKYNNISVDEGGVVYISIDNAIIDYYLGVDNDDDGDIDFTVIPSSFEGNLPPEKPEAPLGPTEIKKDVEYTFNASTIDPDYDDQLYYNFSWGDETYSGWIGPFESGEICDNATHTWTEQQDTCEIKVRAKDAAGCQTEWSEPLEVVVPVRAEFEAVSGYLQANELIYFNDTSVGYYEIVNWTWDFGDGNVSYEQDTSHIYAVDGVYNVTLTVMDNQSNIDVYYQIVTVDSVPPQITNISDTPDIVGFGFDITVSATIDDITSGVDIVKVNITYPDNSYENHTMNNIEGDTYEYIFTDTWLVGQYNYTIWAVDNAENTNVSSQYSFNVSANATISVCTIKNEYGSDEIINITDPPNSGVDEWVIIERGPNFIRRQNIANPNTFSWESAPQWVYNGAAWVPYIFDETDDYYQVQSGLIGTRIYNDGYAEFYSPDMTEVRLYDERWILEYYDNNKWKVCDVYSPTFDVENDNTSINITASFITDYPNSGERVFEVKYIFKEGRPLKHEITFTSHSTDEYLFRVKQQWAGIVSTKVKHDSGIDTIASLTTINSSEFKFLKADGSLSVCENQWEMYYGYNDTTHRRYILTDQNLKPVEIDVHAQGSKADFVFGNWTLSQYESLTIDPDTSTLDNPTEDGCIFWDGGYSRENEISEIEFGGYGDGNWLYDTRGYVEWNISSLAGATLTANPIFKYEGSWDYATEEEINPITEEPPSSISGECEHEKDEKLYGYIANGTAYVNPFNLVVYPGRQVDLGAYAKADLQESMDSSTSWFAIGLQSPSDEGSVDCRTSSIFAEEIEPCPSPTLYIEYTPEPIGTTKYYYYFDSYLVEDEWATNPGNMVNGSIITFAEETEEGLQINDGNTCPGLSQYLGDITKVELRFHGYADQILGEDTMISLIPMFSEGEYDGDEHFEVLTTNASWSSYFDITNDIDAPSPWTWGDVEDLYVAVLTGPDEVTYYCSKVGIRVTTSESKIENIGSTDISGYLLIQVQYNDSGDWVVDNDTINETEPRIIPWDDPVGLPWQNILALDTIFNGNVTTDDLTHGDGMYRVYAAFRDQEGNVLVNDDETEMAAWYEFEVDTS